MLKEKSLIKFRGLILFCIIGLIYFVIEGFWRGFQNWPSLIAECSLWMILIGGISGLILGRINRSNSIRKNCNAFFQSWLASLIITLIELISGLILSAFNITIWSYSHLTYDWLAQFSGGHISFTFMFLWFLLSPFGFWLYDTLTFIFFDDGNFYNLLLPYVQLLQFWRKPNIQKGLIKCQG